MWGAISQAFLKHQSSRVYVNDFISYPNASSQNQIHFNIKFCHCFTKIELGKCILIFHSNLIFVVSSITIKSKDSLCAEDQPFLFNCKRPKFQTAWSFGCSSPCESSHLFLHRWLPHACPTHLERTHPSTSKQLNEKYKSWTACHVGCLLVFWDPSCGTE